MRWNVALQCNAQLWPMPLVMCVTDSRSSRGGVGGEGAKGRGQGGAGVAGGGGGGGRGVPRHHHAMYPAADMSPLPHMRPPQLEDLPVTEHLHHHWCHITIVQQSPPFIIITVHHTFLRRSPPHMCPAPHPPRSLRTCTERPAQTHRAADAKVQALDGPILIVLIVLDSTFFCLATDFAAAAAASPAAA